MSLATRCLQKRVGPETGADACRPRPGKSIERGPVRSGRSDARPPEIGFVLWRFLSIRDRVPTKKIRRNFIPGRNPARILGQNPARLAHLGRSPRWLAKSCESPGAGRFPGVGYEARMG